MTTMNNLTLSSDEIRETDPRVQSHCNDRRSTSRKHERWTRWKCLKGTGMNREHQDEGRVVASFGDADLIRHDNGRWELRGGSPADQAEAREYCSLFQHEATFTRAPLPITAPQVVTRKAAQKRILIADDDALVRESLAAVLEAKASSWMSRQRHGGGPTRPRSCARSRAAGPEHAEDGRLDGVRETGPCVPAGARHRHHCAPATNTRKRSALGWMRSWKSRLDFPVLLRAISKFTHEPRSAHTERITDRGFVTRLLNGNAANHS